MVLTPPAEAPDALASSNGRNLLPLRVFSFWVASTSFSAAQLRPASYAPLLAPPLMAIDKR
jgi:hypothetical protein